jgi:hypothetical protein
LVFDNPDNLIRLSYPLDKVIFDSDGLLYPLDDSNPCVVGPMSIIGHLLSKFGNSSTSLKNKATAARMDILQLICSFEMYYLVNITMD